MLGRVNDAIVLRKFISWWNTILSITRDTQLVIATERVAHLRSGAQSPWSERRSAERKKIEREPGARSAMIFRAPAERKLINCNSYRIEKWTYFSFENEVSI